MAESNGRSSFAFNVPQPVQGQVSGGGSGYRGGGVVGGRIMTGDGDQAAAAVGLANAGTLGNFFEKLAEPYVKREQEARFVKGMTDQMYAQAGEEIRSGNGMLSKIFGPTDYEQGAMFYESQQRISAAVAGWSAREDQLKRMTQEQVAKEWADTLNAARTGDGWLDQQIEQGLVKQAGSMLTSVAKASYKYRQEETLRGQQDSGRLAAKALQDQGAQFFATSDNSEEASIGWQAAVKNFLQGRAQIEGQDDESYRKSIGSQFRMFIREGYGFAATAMLRMGILDTYLDPQERIRAEDEYYRMGARTVGQAASGVMDEIDTLQGRLEFGQLTGTEAVAEMARINEKIKAATGFDSDYFDTSDQEQAVKGVWQARGAAMRREEDRAFQLQRDNMREDRADRRETLKAEVAAAAADNAWQSSNPYGAIAAGAVTNEDMQARAYKAFLDKDFGGMSKAFKSGIVGTGVKNLITNTVASSAASGYSQQFETLYQNFDAMSKSNLAMTKEYFSGDLYAKMMNFRRLRTQQTPSVAFAMAFGNESQYASSSGELAAANKKVKKWVSGQQPGFISGMFTGATALNTSGQQVLANLLTREIAQDTKFSGGDLSEETINTTAYNRVLANGAFEQYGPLGWTNAPGTAPLSRLMGMQPKEASEVVVKTIDDKLKGVGYSDGAYGEEYQIIRQTHNGSPALIVVPIEDNAAVSSKSVVIKLSDLVQAGRNYRTGRISSGRNMPNAPKGLLGKGGAGGDFITENNVNGYGTRNR